MPSRPNIPCDVLRHNDFWRSSVRELANNVFGARNSCRNICERLRNVLSLKTRRLERLLLNTLSLWRDLEALFSRV